MSKNTALATTPKNELAGTNATAGLTWQMEGEDSSDFLIPRVIVHQGDIAEKFYGQHEKGDLIDTSTKEKLPSNTFVPLSAWKEYIRWGDSIGDPPVYVTRKASDVPEIDTKWNGDTPPACTLYRNFAVLFEGMTMPVILSLSDAKKHQRLAGKYLNQLETVRASKGRGRGLYKVKIIDVENKKGKWKDIEIVSNGDPSQEMSEYAAQWIATLSHVELKTNLADEKLGEDSSGFNPDA